MVRSRTLAALLCTTAAVAACADENPTLSPGMPTQNAAASNAPSAEQQATMNEFVRALARALSDEGLRQRMKNDMRKSQVPEHKLEVRAYLRGESGGILLAKLAKETGRSREDLLQMLARLPKLEMYFSIDAHRENWRGGADLQVAGYLPNSGEFMTAYSLAGEQRLLPVSSIPETPTLVVVRQETNFSHTLDLTRYKNVRDQGGQTIGTYMLESCDDPYAIDTCSGDGGGGGGSGGGGSTTTVRYRSNEGYGKVERMFEYKLGRHLESNWLNQGDPELYVIVTSHAPSPTNSTIPYFTSNIRFGAGNSDNTNWYRDNSDLIRWNQEYGNYINLKFYEADSSDMVPITVTFQGKTYGVKISDENDDLGIWTYSFGDQSLTQGYDGHGVGKFGLNTGSGNITVITDYLTP
jgi:hypothetical protein